MAKNCNHWVFFCSFLFINRGERKKYYKHQKKAEKNPEKYLSIIIDVMDQSKTHLPHWVQCSKVSIVDIITVLRYVCWLLIIAASVSSWKETTVTFSRPISQAPYRMAMGWLYASWI